MSDKRMINKKQNKKYKKDANASLTGSCLPEQRDDSLWQIPYVHILIIIISGFIVYFNTFSSPFVFDDYINLVDNPEIRHFNCFPNTTRSVCMLTFALNYALHGLHPFGYHLTNLLIHICNALMVYVFLLRIQTTPVMTICDNSNLTTERESLWYVPLFTALIFICHPIQTQSVTYIVQRFVPLATLFYLGALILYDKSRTSSSKKIRSLTYSLSLLSTVLAMKSKEIAFTLPIIIMLYELMFFQGKISTRFVRLIPFFLTMSIIPLKLLQLTSRGQSQYIDNLQSAVSLGNVGGKASAFEYLITQFGVIVTYIRLLLFPVNQKFDYDYPLQITFYSLDVILPLLLLVTIAGYGVFLVLRSKENKNNRIIAFGIFWFFITLSVESSIVPISDLIFEHRVYLPSIGFIMALLTVTALLYRRHTGIEMAKSKCMTLVFIIVVMILMFTSIARNRIWENDVTFWTDVVRKSPNKERVHDSLGFALFHKGNLDAAIHEFHEALRLNPNFAKAHYNLGLALFIKGNSDAAIHEYQEALRVNPDYTDAHNNLGLALASKGNLNDAIHEYQEALRISPNFAKAHNNLGLAFFKKGNLNDAIHEYQEALRINPNYSDTHNNLGFALASKGNMDAAIHEYQEALRISPNHMLAHNNLRYALAQKKMQDETRR